MCLTHLQIAHTRQAELDLRLKVRTLEIEKQVKMRQLEREAMKIVWGAAVQPVLLKVTSGPSQVTSAQCHNH